MNPKRTIIAFFNEMTSLLQILIFFIIGLLSFPRSMPATMPLAFAVVAILTFISRPLMCIILLKPLKCSLKQCLLISWAGLRGASSIVFAIVAVSSGIRLSFDLFHVVFLVSLFSIAIQGALLPYFSKKLDMVEKNANISKTFNDYGETVDFQFAKVHINEGNSWVGKKIKEIENNKDATNVEQDLMVTLEVCYEFYLRGFHFDTIDIMRSDAVNFLITENGLLPPFVAITRKCPATFSAGTGSMAVTFSPASSCSRFTIAVPRAVRPASGIW